MIIVRRTLQTWLADRYLRRFQLPRDLLAAAADRHPQRTALLTPRGVVTFAELAERVWRLADALAAHDLGRGDRLGYLASNDTDQVEILLAGFELGAVLTGLAPWHPAKLLEGGLNQVSPRMFIHDAAAHPELDHILRTMFPRTERVSSRADYEALLGSGRPVRSTSRIDPADPASLAFTSGTTGRPKALTIPHSAHLASMRLAVLNVGVQIGRPDVVLPGMPLIGAGMSLLLPGLASGATLVLPEDYRTETLLRAIQEHKVTRAFLTPSTLIDLLDTPDLEEYDLSSLHTVIYGSAPLAAAKVAEAVRRLGPILMQGYGLAELLPPISLLHPQEHGLRTAPAGPEVLRSTGRVVPQVQVRIVRPDGHAVPDGEIGEVEVRSAAMCSGYWNAVGPTADAFRGGYLRTRDYGSIDPQGRLCILDRDVDVIVRDGRQIFPRQVEEVAHQHPAVKEACLTEDLGELVLALSLRRLWRRDTQAVVKDVHDYLHAVLPAWQAPHRVQLFIELPRSPLNKVLRREVRAALESDRGVLP